MGTVNPVPAYDMGKICRDFCMQRVRKQVGIPEGNIFKEGCYTGKGVTVAVLDTGVSSHPDLSGRIVGFADFVNNRHIMYDDCGHGTHVCGIIGGNGKASGGKFTGVAPKVHLLVGKVLDQKGDGSAEYMLKGLEWVLSEQKHFNIQVLNISVGIGKIKNYQKERKLLRKMEEARDCGIIVVCAAGNSGPANGSLSVLGLSSKMITVGCHDGNFYKDLENRCEAYSGRGDARSLLRKPDVVAPGTNIISCNMGCKKMGKYYRNAYVAKSGTSMATPIVSGAAALMLEKEPEITAEQLKQRLTFSATDLGEAWNKQGWGMVNVRKMLS